MRELQDIIKKISELNLKNPDTFPILATVVEVRGSSYRLPGAKMLIDAEGNTTGIVSGGCLEADLLERVKILRESEKAQIITYDTTKQENSVFTLNMGCRGVIRILLEPVLNKSYFNFINNCFFRRKTGVAAVVIGTEDENLYPVGRRFFMTEDDFGTGGEKIFLSEAKRIFKQKNSECGVYKTEKGSVEFFFEVIIPPMNLLVFGAGADAEPLVRFAKLLGWRVSLIDFRSAYAQKERFPEADEIHLIKPEEFEGFGIYAQNSAAVLMSHNFEADKKYLQLLLNSEISYIGILGPKSRTQKMLAELSENGDISELAKTDKIYAPVGLDIGADSPEEIALAIISEIKTVLSKREGGFLRERKGGIH